MKMKTIGANKKIGGGKMGGGGKEYEGKTRINRTVANWLPTSSLPQ